MSESIIRVIQNLQKLAGNNPNEHERQAAADKAAEMMEKHNINQATVDQTFLTSKPVQKEHPIPTDMVPYLRTIMRACCLLYFTNYYRAPKLSKTGNFAGYNPVIVGTPENIEVTRSMFDWLRKTIESEGRKKYAGYANAESLAHSFWRGAGDMLLQRAHNHMKVPQKETTGYSLMVVRNSLQKANEDYLESLDLGKSRNSTSTFSPNAFAYNQGATFSKNLNLGRQIKETKKLK